MENLRRLKHIPTRIRLTTGRIFLTPFCLTLALLFCLGPATGAAAREVPGYKGYVNDYAAMMSPAERSKLEQVLHSFDLSDSTQVAILTIDSLEGDPIEDFGIRVVDQWQIGQKEKDNGVLFLAVKNDRKMRIEVGRGLEHLLTDLAAGRIIDLVVAPLFKQGQIDKGFEAGVSAIIKTTRGEYTADSIPRGRGGAPPLFKYLLFGSVFLFFLSSNSKLLGILGGAVLLPVIFLLGLPGHITWLFLLLLSPVGALAGLTLSSMFSAMPRHGSSGGGGYYMGGGGFGGGGFGGGGFGGFGGGGFGGGGASGGW